MADGAEPLAQTVALLTLVGALITGVVGAMEWSRGSLATALFITGAAAIGFIASLVYFVVDGRRAEAVATELPFPSWLRTEPESALAD